MSAFSAQRGGKPASGPPAGLGHLDSRSLAKLKLQALEKARRLQQQVQAGASENWSQARQLGSDLAASRTAGEAGAKAFSAWKLFERGALLKGLCRFLICLYFCNLVLEDVLNWRQWRQPELRARMAKFPERMRPVHFPLVGLAFVLPCAALAALGVRVPLTASALVLEMMWKSTEMVTQDLYLLLRYRQQPNELFVKKLSILGCILLVLAHSVRDAKPVPKSYAGMLLGGGEEGEGARLSRWRSALLLAGRLLMACFFLHVGVMQLRRLRLREWRWVSEFQPADRSRRDGHDSNLLFLEALLAIPFAAGWQLGVVTRVQAALLVAEALWCWPLTTRWPTWQYQAHVRSHFLVNLALAAGLTLLQGFGAGSFTADRVARKKAF